MGKKIKVLHVLKSSSYAGAEKIAITICTSLKGRYEFAYTSANGAIAKTLEEAGIPFYPMQRLCLLELRNVMAQYQPDIVHAHDFTASVLCAAIKEDYKLISHLHSNPGWIKSWNIRSLLYQQSQKKIDQVLLVSKAIQEKTVFFGSRKGHQIELLENPVDKRQILEKAEAFQPGEIDLLFIGRLVKQKDPQYFLKIVKELKKEKNNISAVMLGSGKLKKTLRKMAIRMGIDENVRLPGFVENPFPYLKHAKLLAVTSYEEGYGLAAAEAAVLGTPVLARPVGGLHTIFGDVPEVFCASQEAFCKKAAKLLADDACCSSFKKKIARKAVVTDVQAYRERMDRIYRGLNG